MSTYAEMFQTIRDQRTADPLHVLRITVELIESLRGDTFATITEARRAGATWDQIASALHERPEAVRCEYAAMVNWITTDRPGSVDLDRFRASL